MFRKLSPFSHHLFLFASDATFWVAHFIGILAWIPLLVLAVASPWLSFTLEPTTVVYWVAMLFLLSAIAASLKFLVHLAFQTTREGDELVLPFCRDSDKLLLRSAYPYVLASVALIYRRWDMLWSGSAWIPFVLLSLSLFNLWFFYSRRPFGISKQLVSFDDWVVYRNGSDHQAVRSPSSGQQSQEPAKAVVTIAKPRTTFANIYGMADLKGRLMEAGAPVFEGKRAKGEDCRNGILLFGGPGNGKTAIAEALAGELGVKFLALDYSKVVSQWVGETARNITTAFGQARAAGPCVLFIDEIDSFIVNRDSASQNTAEGANIVNLLLTELVNIRQYPVLVMAATNRLAKLDSAAIREGRFDYKIEITPPDAEARLGLLQSSLKKHVSSAAVDAAAVQSAAARWEGFSVKRILAVGEEMPSYLREHPSAVVGYDELMGALRRLQGRKGSVPANTKSLQDLVLPTETSKAVRLISNRISDPLRIERLGGALPGGILFHGPSGTGKTAVARALAKETGWAFLSVAGPDLMRDLDKMDELYAEAKDIRPCLIFIDEADDILRDRQYSNSSALTNKLLALMDGADGRVKDVVFIAATNNPEQIDPAMLRAGRFTEKVPFFPADAQSVAMIVEKWLQPRKASLAPGVTVSLVARLLDGQSPANVEGVMQYAINLAIDEHEGDVVRISLDHVGQAMQVVISN